MFVQNANQERYSAPNLTNLVMMVTYTEFCRNLDQEVVNDVIRYWLKLSDI